MKQFIHSVMREDGGFLCCIGDKEAQYGVWVCEPVCVLGGWGDGVGTGQFVLIGSDEDKLLSHPQQSPLAKSLEDNSTWWQTCVCPVNTRPLTVTLV